MRNAKDAELKSWCRQSARLVLNGVHPLETEVMKLAAACYIPTQRARRLIQQEIERIAPSAAGERREGTLRFLS